MKILHVITSLNIGGAEKLLADMIPQLRDKGYFVDILLFDGTETFLKRKIESEGFNIFSLSIGGNVYNPLYILKLLSYIPKYDIIHTHNTACQYYVAIARSFIGDKPKLVTTEHSTSNHHRNIFFFRLLDKWIYHCYSAVIAISPQVATSLEMYLKRYIPIDIIYNGVNLKLYKDAYSIDRDNTKIVVTMVAGFRKEKDQDTLIKSMALLNDKYILWLVGDGVRMNECKKIVDDLHLIDRVLFWGVSNNIPNILKASDIMVMSSHWEGFGLAAVEGMAAGKPVIVSDVEGLSEVVGDAGLLFERGDFETLASHIIKLSTNKDFYKEMSYKSAKQATKYSINQMVDQYIELYENL